MVNGFFLFTHHYIIANLQLKLNQLKMTLELTDTDNSQNDKKKLLFQLLSKQIVKKAE